MQAKISIAHFGRKRMIRFDDLFIGNDPKGELRTEWSSLYQAFHRNKFEIRLNLAQVTYDGLPIGEATSGYVEMFSRMEDWCNKNCVGLWTTWDNESEIDDNAVEVELEANFMFEHEDDLLRFIKDSAVLMRLTY